MEPDAVLHVSTSDPTPPYEQLRRQLVELIGSGRLKRGRRLPPVRQLAFDLGLAVGTVARTYREVEAEGLVVTRRGGGTRASDDVPQRPTPAPASELQDHVTAVVRRARRLGATDEQIRAAVETALETRAAPRRSCYLPGRVPLGPGYASGDVISPNRTSPRQAALGLSRCEDLADTSVGARSRNVTSRSCAAGSARRRCVGR